VLLLIADTVVCGFGAGRASERIHNDLTLDISQPDPVTDDAFGYSFFRVGADTAGENHFTGSHVDGDIQRIY
jgi:hypothetical protein